MNTPYLFCYTRTRNIDYRNIYSVSTSVCPQYVQDLFLRRLSALLNNTEDEDLYSPIYVYFRHEAIVLYGIVCLNSMLSADFCLEKTNGRVRGFFGVLETCEVPIRGIPLSLDFYTQLYAQYIIPKWNSFTFHYHEDVVLNSTFEAADIVTPSCTRGNINDDLSQCRLFPSSRNARTLLAEALTHSGEMSVAVGITDCAQVTQDNGSLLNATFRGDDTGAYEDVTVYHICTTCGKKVTQLFANGLCADCYQKAQTPNPTPQPNPDTDTDTNMEKDSDKTPHFYYHCHACGEKASQLYTEKGLCGKCYKRYVERKKRKLQLACLFVCLLAVGGLAYFFQKNPLSGFLKSENFLPIDSLDESFLQTSIDSVGKDSVKIDSLKNSSLQK